MTPIQELEERIRASARYTFSVGGITFRVELPDPQTEHELLEANAGRSMRGLRAFIDVAVTGWQGATFGHVAGDGDSTALEFSDNARRLLFNARTDLRDEVGADIMERLRARRARREDEAKN